MGKTILTITSLLISLNLAYTQPFDHPAAYNNFIVEAMNEVTFRNLEYISQAVHTENFDEIERKRNRVIEEIKAAEHKIKTTTPFQGGEALQTEAQAVMQMYQSVFEVDLKDANFLKQSSKESYEAMEAYFKAQDAAERNLAKAGDRFQRAEKIYVQKYNIKFEQNSDNELNDQLNTISEVNEYARRLFLIYFRMSKYSSDFLDAVQKQESASLEGKRRRIETASTTALAELQKMDGFRGDRDYLDKTIALVKFYNDLSKGGFIDVVRLLKKQERDWTQDDVDAFNRAIETLNAQAPQLINDFNQAQVELLQKHVPKHNVTDKKLKRT